MLRYAYFLQICFCTIIRFAAIKVGLKWDEVFKSGPCKIFGIQPLKSLNEYALVKADHTPSNFLKAEFHKFYLVHY